MRVTSGSGPSTGAEAVGGPHRRGPSGVVADGPGSRGDHTVVVAGDIGLPTTARIDEQRERSAATANA